jgi:hypothetical protein
VAGLCLVFTVLAIGSLYAVATGVQRGLDHHRAMGSSGIAGQLTVFTCDSGRRAEAPRCTGQFQAAGLAAQPVRVADVRADDDWSARPLMRVSSAHSGLAWSHSFSWTTMLFGLVFRGFFLLVFVAIVVPRVLRGFGSTMSPVPAIA